MTTKKAIEIALQEIEGQLGSEDLSPEGRKLLTAAAKKLHAFIKVTFN